MKLIFALGNPGPEYAKSRHNIGFLALDYLTERFNAGDFTTKSKFQAEISELNYQGEKIIIAKPTTFYNLVGVSARSITDFYQIPPEYILVIHDDLTLGFGKIRIRKGGSDGGSNGIKSLNQHLGSDYWHLKIGTDSDRRALIANDANFVLSSLTQEEKSLLSSPILPQVYNFSIRFLDNRLAPETETL